MTVITVVKDFDEAAFKQWAYEFKLYTGEDCNGKLKVYYNRHGQVRKLRCLKKKPRVHKRGRGGKRFHTSGAHDRYREKDLSYQSKALVAGSKVGVFKTYNVNGSVASSANIQLTGTPLGSSNLTRTWDKINPGPPYRTGGPFACLHYELPHSQPTGAMTLSSTGNPAFTGDARWEYTGQFVDNGVWGSDSLGSYVAAGVPDLSGYDTRAWDELKPQVSKAPLAQFLYELRDLPRMLQTTAQDAWNLYRGLAFRDGLGGTDYWRAITMPDRVSDSFLNHQFGWAPFLSDLSKLYDVWQQSHDYMSQLVFENDRWVRKRRVLERAESDNLLNRYYIPQVDPFGFQLQGICKDMVIDGITCKGFTDIREEKSTRVWATGFFKYYRPEFDDNLASFGTQLGAMNRLLTLYGLRINPTLVYKLTPWSWLVDWFTRFGDYIQRADDFIVDGIVTRALYVMRETTRVVTKTVVINTWSGTRTFRWQRKTSIKQRKVADSPYGFDRTWNNLSVRQMAILGAIGTTRSSTGFISRG